MSRPMWFVNLLKFAFPGRFGLAKLTRFPPIGKLTDWALFRGDDVIYLPKDNVVPIGLDIPVGGDMVLPSQVVNHFIEQASHHWVMDFCICREGDDCQDYPQEYGCLFLGEAVLKINPQLGRLVSTEEALTHAQRCREAGLVHMIGRNRLDQVWLGATPGEKLMTICNCCPCCCIWKMLPDLEASIGDKIGRMPGVNITVTDLCEGCGTCADPEVCFVNAISLVGERAEISAACRGCGRCVEACLNQAIELTISEMDVVQNAIERLAPLVDIT